MIDHKALFCADLICRGLHAVGMLEYLTQQLGLTTVRAFNSDHMLIWKMMLPI